MLIDISAVEAGRMVSNFYLARGGTKQEQDAAWKRVPSISRAAIGTYAQQLNKHSIDWRSFGSIREMADAERDLQERLAAEVEQERLLREDELRSMIAMPLNKDDN
jgi:hypothetical protein